MNILFVCTGNTCRSPMAMAYTNYIADIKKLNIVADSAGLSALFDPINPKAAMALKKQNIPFSNYLSKPITYEMIDKADLICCMTSSHLNALVGVGVKKEKLTVLNGGISDPFGCDEETYDNCLEQIVLAVDEIIAKIESEKI